MSKLSRRNLRKSKIEHVIIVSGVQRTTEPGLKKKSGGDGAVVTPVPIPNTEVKHRSGEDRTLEPENSALPGFFFYGRLYASFFSCFMSIIAS
jgi:hypothetical protein